ncbi:hypothetical protein [Rhodoplanes roseus]|uniref:Uncharacterized protein n=1 Tax=Rhodoplanes roseus TaxID=29409 RepID=A0A327L400_9BRAD|nr:hypothetical protein [Rhodoplanes roseus]RAI44232.1 hypothetical protein CH341_10255 [Rhodoplanes roseus]
MPNASSTDAAAFDRRRFLGGVWRSGPSEPSPSRIPKPDPAPTRLLLQIAPARFDAVAGAVAALDGIRLVDRRPPAPLIAAVPSDAVGAALAALAAMPGVLTANAVPSDSEELT